MLLWIRARAEGFSVNQFENGYEEARQRIARWIRDGRIKYKEDVVQGLENAPRAFIGLMQWGNFGKLLVKVSEE